MGKYFPRRIIGLGVDMATGGLYIYDKDNISGNLARVPVGNLQKNNTELLLKCVTVLFIFFVSLP